MGLVKFCVSKEEEGEGSQPGSDTASSKASLCVHVPLCSQAVCTVVYTWDLTGHLLSGLMCLSRGSRHLVRSPVRASPWVHVLCVHVAPVQVGTIGCVTGSQYGQACEGSVPFGIWSRAACTGVVVGSSPT